ncbi:MAG: TIGR03936 family radical SAM-associated protein, partial [bacterium]
ALDLTRAFMRAFSRSGVPLKFSEGFPPAPIISFGPALGVGTESAEEFLDFETIVEIPPEELQQMLNAQMPDGLRFLSLQIIDAKSDALFKIISAAEYSVPLNSDHFNDLIKKKVNGKFNGNLADLHESVVADFMNRDIIEIEKISKGRKRMQNIKPLIKKLKVVNSKQPLQLRMILSTGSSGNVRPEAVLKQMYDDSADLLKIRRERLLVEKAGEFCSPLE